MSKSLPDLKAAMKDLGVKVVEVAELGNRACWVETQRILLVRPGESDSDLEIIKWARDMAGHHGPSYPLPTDTPLPTWATDAVPEFGLPDGWAWDEEEKVWARCPRYYVQGGGWEVCVEGEQIALESGEIEDTHNYITTVECGGREKWTPEAMRLFAKALDKAADILEQLLADAQKAIA